MERLIIHIGAPKAGSTSAQKYLWDHRIELLEQRSLLFPETGYARLAHHNLAYALSPTYRRVGKFEPDVGDWPQALDEMRDSGAAVALVSSEAFFRIPVKSVERLLGIVEGIDTTIVAFVRRQDLTLESTYNQFARHGRVDVGVEEYLEANRAVFDHATYLGHWADVFGDQRMRVVPFERDRLRRGVTAAMLEACGLDADDLPGTEPRSNPKAGWKHIQGVRYVQARCRADMGADFHLPPIAIKGVSKRFRTDPTDVTDYALVDYDLGVRVFESFADSNRELVRRFGPADGPELFFQPPQPQEYRKGPPSADLTSDDRAYLDALAERTLAEVRSA